MDDANNLDFKGLLRWVHSPLISKDVYSIMTERKPFSSTSVYRILYHPVKTPAGTYEDVVSPVYKVIRHIPREKMAVKFFYRGAEEMLDRYLRWLNRFYLKNEYGSSPSIYVLEQLTALAQEEIEEQFGPESSVVLGPYDHTLFGVLTAEKESDVFLF